LTTEGENFARLQDNGTETNVFAQAMVSFCQENASLKFPDKEPETFYH
jgi:hypothetical protein